MKYLLTISLSILFFVAKAQDGQRGLLDFDDKWHIGFKAGGTYSFIYDLESTIIREWYDQDTYSAKREAPWGFAGGMFFYYRFKGSLVVFQPEITYAMYGSNIHYTDTIRLSPIDTVGLDYLMKFRYQYIALSPMLKIFFASPDKDNFFSRLHFEVGAQLGINIAPENISYVSNKPFLGPDLQIQQNLRGVLKGKTDLSVALGLGYELTGKTPLIFEARANLGFVDTVETLANGYNFIENPNRSISFQATIGYVFPLGD